MFAKPLFKPLPLLRVDNLQFFAEDGGDDDVDDDEGGDDEPDLTELLKNPKYKKQHQELFKLQLNKRLKKYEDVDVEEYRRLKEQAESKKKKQEDDENDEVEELKRQNQEKEKKIARAELREKRALVKEFAVDQGVDPKLLSRLIDVTAIELDDDGEAENLDELFEELQEEFPEYFTVQDEEEVKITKRSHYSAGPRQKTNKKPKEKDGYEAGMKEFERLKKLGKIKFK